MLRDNETLVYIHVPKCAGTTFTRILDGYFAREVIYPYKLWAKLPPVEERRPAFAGKRLVRGHIYPVVADYVEAPVLITMLRDPVERAVSAYYFLRRSVRTDRKQLPEFVRAQTLDIDAFFAGLGMDHPNNGAAHILGQAGEPEPLLIDEKVANAKAFIDRCAVVGLVERFGESLALMCDRLGWDYPAMPRSENVGHDRLRVEAINPETVARIRQCNWADYEVYRYARDRFERDLAVMDEERPICC